MHENPYQTPLTSGPGRPPDLPLLDAFVAYGADHSWLVTTSMMTHAVRLQHGFWTGQVIVELDEKIVHFRARKLIDWGLRYDFLLDGSPIAVSVKNSWLPFRYELLGTGVDIRHQVSAPI